MEFDETAVIWGHINKIKIISGLNEIMSSPIFTTPGAFLRLQYRHPLTECDN